MKRRTVQDLITLYRRARRKRDPDEIQAASLELGAALQQTGILAEIPPDCKSAIIWQPVAVEGGPAGFAHNRFKATHGVAAPKYRPQPAPQLQTA